MRSVLIAAVLLLTAGSWPCHAGPAAPDSLPPQLAPIAARDGLEIATPPMIPRQRSDFWASELMRERGRAGKTEFVLLPTPPTSALWCGEGSFGDELYGLALGDHRELGVGVAPIMCGLAATGYATGFRYARGGWELRGDFRTRPGEATGLRTLTQGLSAALSLSKDVTLRIDYQGRLADFGRGSTRDDRIGGHVEFGF